jgi:hypothetical protein
LLLQIPKNLDDTAISECVRAENIAGHIHEGLIDTTAASGLLHGNADQCWRLLSE